MPGKDGTGPLGQGTVTGRTNRTGQRRSAGVGPSGYCICPKCGERTSHASGVPCFNLKCLKCGSPLIRGS